uniref:Uncharacterized protein n=2 Tax=viral metagenome TaxID=1070528 RepID=A0A6M3JSK9_9ZZZZ
MWGDIKEVTDMSWSETIGQKYGLSIRKVEAIWATGQGITNSCSPLSTKEKKIYEEAEKARRIEITGSLESILEEMKREDLR